MQVAILIIIFALGCYAEPFADQGTVYVTGTITNIENQQTCDLFGCHIGSTWTYAMHFRADHWNAPGSNYSISTVLLNCFGGPPCIDGYEATSDFGWAPYGFDILSLQITDGKLVEADLGAGIYFSEWGKVDRWARSDSFSGTTAGYATPNPAAPEPATVLTFATAGTVMHLIRRIR